MTDNLLLSAPATTDQALYDARAIHDTADLRFDVVEKAVGGVWVVIRIAPALHSGSATIIGASIDIESGDMIDTVTGTVLSPGAARGGIIEEGSWELVATLSDSPAASRGQYSWTKPRQTHIRKLEAEHLYQPFAQGGIVLSLHNPSAQGAAQFESVHLIPPGWEASIRPANDVFKKSPHCFTAPALSHYAELRGMLRADNSVIAVMAFRTLLENGKIDTLSLRDALDRSEGYRRAALVYLLLVAPGQIDQSALHAELNAVIDATSTPEGHRPFALGVAAARLLHPESPASQTLVPKVLNASRARLASGTDADPYLRRLLDIAGLPGN